MNLAIMIIKISKELFVVEKSCQTAIRGHELEKITCYFKDEESFVQNTDKLKNTT